MTKLVYHIQASHPEAHLFSVRCELLTPEPKGQHFSLPNWIPGSYMIRDFAKHILSLKASAGGKDILCRQLTKSSWECEPVTEPLTLTYQVYAWDLSVRGAHLDTTHGFFNGACMFMAFDNHTNEPCEVNISRPDGTPYQSWAVATSLPLKSAQLYEFGTYQASNYDELIDHPVEMGLFAKTQFLAHGVPHDIIITGKHQANLQRIKHDLQQLCEYQINFFGQPAPFDYYVFLVFALGKGSYGGLEHRASCALHTPRDNLVIGNDEPVSNNYSEFLSLCSHEYFHSWNIKRIKPSVFMPYPLQQETYTELLWVFEGFTSYYEDLLLVRCQLITPQQFLKMFAQKISRVLREPGRHQQTVAESSFTAWTKFYQRNENSPNAGVSYYIKGAVIALALDLHLRTTSNGHASLDTVMQYLWNNYGKQKKGIDESAIAEIIKNAVGFDVDGFLNDTVNSTQDVALDDYLKAVGIELSLTAPPLSNELSDTTLATNKNNLIELGIAVLAIPEGIQVKTVYSDSSAEDAGIAPGDILIAFNNLKLDSTIWFKQLQQHEVGDTVVIHGFRRDELISFSITLQQAKATYCTLTLLEKVSDAILQQRNTWLGITL